MRVLLDENLPHDLIAALSGHEVSTVQGMGWAGVENGDLLHRASGRADAFITMDRKLERQQNLAALPFGVVLIVARSNRGARVPMVFTQDTGCRSSRRSIRC